jgi:predicted nucleic acid-binding Zn ribbon protein
VKNRPVVIKDVLDGILDNLGGGKISQVRILNAAWSKAVGEAGAKHAKPIDIKDGVLVVHVDSSSWLHKLTMEKGRILAQIKNELGEDPVKDIKLRIGSLLY